MKKQRPRLPLGGPGVEPVSADRPAVKISNLSFSYRGQPALTDVSIRAPNGEIVGVLGPNGSGKSTLFRILSTLMVPSAGNIEIDGVDILLSPDLARRRTGIVFQTCGLDVKLTVEENLMFHGQFYGIGGAMLSARVHHLLKTFGILERRNDKVEELSGGLQRRVELARGLLHQPAVLILDEPTTGLDPAARMDFWQFLTRSVAEAGTTVLLTTHLIEEAEQCDQVVIMDRGAIVVSGSPAELKASLGGDVVVIAADDPERLLKRIKRGFGIQGTVVDGKLQLENADGTRLVPRLSKEFAASIESITIRKPGLQDVFLRKTGHRLGGQANTEGVRS